MGKRVLIIEEDDGWGIFDAMNSDELIEQIADRKEGLKIAKERHYELPLMNIKSAFFSDMDGRPLYITVPSKSGQLELEYVDGGPCLDFEICATCKGPAFGRDSASKRRNCYYCPSCGQDVDCVPPPEWIGELD